MTNRIAASVITVLSVFGFVIGGAATSLASPPDLEHMVVSVGSGQSETVMEIWSDEQRGLAQVHERAPDGESWHSSGTNWLLDIPADESRPALKYEITTGRTVASAAASLYYFRDALRAGRAQIEARTAKELVVRGHTGRRAVIDAETGLPLREFSGTETRTYEYRVRDRLPAAGFPASFFANTRGRSVVTTTETDWIGAGQLASISPIRAGSSALGRPLEVVVFKADPQGRTLEQVHAIYGRDVQVVTSLLSSVPSQVRPGGTTVTTVLGSGRLFVDQGHAQITILRGALDVSVFAPDAATALAIARLLGES